MNGKQPFHCLEFYKNFTFYDQVSAVSLADRQSLIRNWHQPLNLDLDRAQVELVDHAGSVHGLE